MTPSVLPELLTAFAADFEEHLWLLETDPEAFFRHLERFVTFVVCRSYREGTRDQWKRLREPSEN